MSLLGVDRRPDSPERRAELHLMAQVLDDARTLVERDWVQRAWFVVHRDGVRRPVTARQLDLLDGSPVAGACLVGAIVHGGGGPSRVRSQLVQRTLDLTWHALRDDPDRPVRWCPGPPVRLAHLRDLTRWNDAPGRRADDVVGLLTSARALVARQSQATPVPRRLEPGQHQAAVGAHHLTGGEAGLG